MIRGMYAGISGMKAQQNKLDVIGNNLANVSTTGFKGSRVVFKRYDVSEFIKCSWGVK